MKQKKDKTGKLKNWIKNAYKKSSAILIKILPDIIGAVVKNLIN